MNLRELHLSDLAVIPGAVDVSGGTSQKREQSFHVDEGWELREVLPGVFSISRADMPHAVTVGGVGYSYVAMPPTHAPPEPLGVDEQGRPWTVQRKLDPTREAGMTLDVASPDYDSMTDAQCCAAGFHRREGEGACSCGYKPGSQPAVVQHHRKGKR